MAFNVLLITVGKIHCIIVEAELIKVIVMPMSGMNISDIVLFKVFEVIHSLLEPSPYWV